MSVIAVRHMQRVTISPGSPTTDQFPAKSRMNELIRTTSVPQGACQHARDRAYAMCDALCERLARESLPLLRLRAVVLRALIDVVFLRWFELTLLLR